MSSHHIVREKQEPALLILGLNGFTDEELGQLLEWSPTVIATPAVAEQLAVYGIKIDYVVGGNTGNLLQSDVKFIEVHAGDFLQVALNFLIKQGYPAVNLVTDELELSFYEAYINQINIVIYHNGLKIYAVSPGFRKWKPAGELVMLLTPSIAVKAEGLNQISEQEYQTNTDGFFSLVFDAPGIFIAEVY